MANPLTDDFTYTKFNKPTIEMTDIEKKNIIINNIQKEYDIQMNKSNKVYKMYSEPDKIRIQSRKHLIYPNTSTFQQRQGILMLSKIKGIEQSIIIEKKTQRILFVKYMFNKELFENDTIFEGELLYDRKIKWIFLISDILVYKGDKLNKTNLYKRLELINDILQNMYITIKRIESLDLLVKDFVEIDQQDELFENIVPKLRYGHLVNGLVYRPINGYYNYIKINRQKYKNDKNNSSVGETIKSMHDTNITISTHDIVEHKKFVVPENVKTFRALVKYVDDDVYIICLKDFKNNVVKYGYAHIKTLRDSKNISRIFDEIDCVENSDVSKQCVMLCNYVDNQIIPIKKEESDQFDSYLSLLSCSKNNP
jgi:hypothetical protein